MASEKNETVTIGLAGFLDMRDTLEKQRATISTLTARVGELEEADKLSRQMIEERDLIIHKLKAQQPKLRTFECTPLDWVPGDSNEKLVPILGDDAAIEQLRIRWDEILRLRKELDQQPTEELRKIHARLCEVAKVIGVDQPTDMSSLTIIAVIENEAYKSRVPPVPPAGETASDGSVMIDGMKLTPVPKEQIGTFTFQDAADIEAQTPINSPAPEPSPAGTVEGLVRTIERALNHATYPSRPIDGRNEIQIGNEAHVALTALASERETLEGLLRECSQPIKTLRLNGKWSVPFRMKLDELSARIDAALSHTEKQG